MRPAVCNDFGNNVPYSAYLEAFSQIRAPVVFPTAAPNLEPRDDIWPTETAPVCRRCEHGVEMVQLRWGFPPARPKGAPVINFRSRRPRNGRPRSIVTCGQNDRRAARPAMVRSSAFGGYPTRSTRVSAATVSIPPSAALSRPTVQRRSTRASRSCRSWVFCRRPARASSAPSARLSGGSSLMGL
jgi:hypothetical protein